ncbi:brachyurin-like [Ostrinia nubilalis]|uniref:Putative chymotrypsin 8 n=1 Tax=Ostrinia nubilalis TaxID=29057 RepID=I6SJ44_OSTNU|nr:putative chymotrypsin 8 [Ostrinia nubilalis]
MRLVFVVFALVSSVLGSVEVFGPRGYHEEVGIPLAKELKAAEERNVASIARLANEFEDRVVGGVAAPIAAHPYLGGLVISFFNIAGNSVCGSSLVSATRLVTAAHCWFDGVNQANLFTVVLGTNFIWSGGLRISTSSVFMHPQWTPSNLSNDIAVIYLPWAISFSNVIQPIALPSSWDLHQTFEGQWAVAAGFGKTTDSQVGPSAQINQVNLQVISEQACRNVYGANFVFPSTLCTSGLGFVGVCSGDSGGPLFVTRNGQRTLIGVSSFVASNNCQGGHPSAFARVTSFVNFIQQHMW